MKLLVPCRFHHSCRDWDHSHHSRPCPCHHPYMHTHTIQPDSEEFDDIIICKLDERERSTYCAGSICTTGTVKTFINVVHTPASSVACHAGTIPASKLILENGGTTIINTEASDPVYAYSACAPITAETICCTLINIFCAEWSSVQGAVAGIASNIVLETDKGLL